MFVRLAGFEANKFEETFGTPTVDVFLYDIRSSFSFVLSVEFTDRIAHKVPTGFDASMASVINAAVPHSLLPH
jgi:hypothetical protein